MIAVLPLYVAIEILSRGDFYTHNDRHIYLRNVIICEVSRILLLPTSEYTAEAFYYYYYAPEYNHTYIVELTTALE